MEKTNLIPHHGVVQLYERFFTETEADRMLAELSREVSWKQEPIKIFGKEIMQPRLTSWYSDPGVTYSYSGIKMEGQPWLAPLTRIKSRIEPVAGVKFTGALLNYYRDGNDSMGWHRDNEKVLGLNPVIGSVSLGESRIFQFRDYHTKNGLISLNLSHGSFLIMSGETQHFWEHRLPKNTGVRLPRLNMTFRVIPPQSPA